MLTTFSVSTVQQGYRYAKDKYSDVHASTVVGLLSAQDPCPHLAFYYIHCERIYYRECKGRHRQF